MEHIILGAMVALLAGSLYFVVNGWRQAPDPTTGRIAAPIIFVPLVIAFNMFLARFSLAVTTAIVLVSAPIISLLVISQVDERTDTSADRVRIVSSSCLFAAVLAIVAYLIRTGTGAIALVAAGVVGGMLVVALPKQISSLKRARS